MTKGKIIRDWVVNSWSKMLQPNTQNAIIPVTTNGLLTVGKLSDFDTGFILSERSKRNLGKSIRRCLAAGKVT